MSEDRKYVRVYHDDLIRDYPEVYDDDALLSAWLRLLVIADQMWPTAPELPRSIKARPLARLTASGLVMVLPRHRYRIRGLDAERTRRADAGRNAAAKRWHDKGNADGNADPMPSRDETSKAEPSRAKSEQSARETEDGRADLEAFLVLTRRAPTPRQRRLLDEVLDRHDLTGPAWSADVMFKHPDDPIGAVIEADKAWRSERIAQAQAAESPKPIPRRLRGNPQTTREIMEEMAILKRESA